MKKFLGTVLVAMLVGCSPPPPPQVECKFKVGQTVNIKISNTPGMIISFVTNTKTSTCFYWVRYATKTGEIDTKGAMSEYELETK